MAKHLHDLLDEILSELNGKMFPPRYKIISSDDELDIDGNKVWTIEVDDEVMDWMRVTFIEGVDYIPSRTLKGVWVETTDEKVVALLKLKWTK